MSSEGKLIETAAGHAGVLRIRAIAKTSIGFTAPSLKISTLRTNVSITGAVQNLPNDTPATFTWIVQKGSIEERYPVAGVVIKVQDKTRGSVTVALDVLEHRLIGKGKVGFEIAPDFPYCAAQVVPPGSITFDNPLEVTFSKTSGVRMGTKVKITPNIGEIFAKSTVRLELRERDVGANESATTDDFMRPFVWKNGNEDSVEWRVGCTLPSGVPVLDYLEPDEVGGYEFEYSLSVATDGEKNYQTIVDAKELFSVPKPKIESFELTAESSSVLDDGYLGSVLHNIWSDDIKDIPLERLRAKGRISNLDEDLELPVRIALWAKDAAGAVAPFKNIEAEVLLDEGEIDVQLCSFCALANDEDWPKIKASTFFAVLRLPIAVTGTPDYVPIVHALDYDDKVLLPFHKGEGTVSVRGTGVASKGSQIKITSDGLVRHGQIQVGGKWFVDWFNSDVQPKNKDLYPNPMKGEGFKKIFSHIKAMSGKPAITLNEFLAHAMIMYNELGGTYEPKAEKGGMQYCFEPKGSKVSYNGGYHRFAGNQLKAKGVISSDADVNLWNGQVWPEGQSAAVYKAAEECDFYKYRGRGLNQLTWRGNYQKHADPFLKEHPKYKKCADDLTTAQLDEAFKDPAIYLASFNSYNMANEKVRAALEKVLKGDFNDYGLRVGGSSEYGTKFANRCKKLLELMTKAGYTT